MTDKGYLAVCDPYLAFVSSALLEAWWGPEGTLLWENWCAP